MDIEGYTYSYAAVTYTYTTTTSSGPGQGGQTTTTSTETVTAESLRITGVNSNMGTTTYTASIDGSTVNNITGISVTLYYEPTTPKVTISASTTDAAVSYTLTVETENFTGDPTNVWTISDASLAELRENKNGTVTVLWSDDVQDGDSVTVTVTSTYTYDDGSGTEVTETATDSYVLTYYGERTLEVTVYYQNTSTVAAGATVNLLDSDGNVVATGTTDSDGKVTFSAVPGTYTLEASVTDGSTAYTGTYGINDTVTIDGSGTTTQTTLRLVRTDFGQYSTSEPFQHIDIKNALASDGTSTESLDDVTKVVVTNGTYIYTAEGSGTGDYQISSQSSEWYVGGTGGSRVYENYLTANATIQITYTVDGVSYTATITSSSTYASGTYYPASGECAYKLYNYLYGTSYSSNTALQNAGISQINISGMSMFLVATILCNNSTVSYGSVSSWLGMDFAVSVASLKQYTANFDLEAKKTYNADLDGDDFQFVLYAAAVDDSSGVWTTSGTAPEDSETNDAASLSGGAETVSDIIDFNQITYSSSGTYYYILYEDATYYTIEDVTYDTTVYGIKVVADTSTGTVTRTYYLLTDDGNGGYTATQIASETTLTDDSYSKYISFTKDGLPIFAFTNTYEEEKTADVTVKKVSEDGTELTGATFTLSKTEDSTTYYYNGTEWVTPGAGEEAPTITLDSVTVALAAGTYTLTEISAPAGYYLLSDAVSFTVTIDNNGTANLTTNSGEYITLDNDDLVVKVKNTKLYSLPEAGSTGTYLFTISGVAILMTALLLFITNKQKEKGGQVRR
ncbi:MAG: LPXTG cell wall anchor domain-containing protein [Lachnospiraceae bacterium]|nr:LPXTG cell wall anchor domain-containing protein [Lachnospiraceae bacterium]